MPAIAHPRVSAVVGILPHTTDRNLTSLTLYNAAGSVISATQYLGTSMARTALIQCDSAGRPVTVAPSEDWL